jgi:hypothetical protein
MPAKARVPGDALSCFDRFRGHGPLLQYGGRCPTRCGSGPRFFCRSGPCPRKRGFRLKRFLASTAFADAGRSYTTAVDAPPAVEAGHAFL